MQKGWIALHRQIKDNMLWQDKPYSKGQAWIDLLLTANYVEKKILFDGGLLLVNRGSLVTSIRKLSDQWGWSKDKTSKFLRLLESDNMIVKNTNSKRTLITIVNYGFYQDIKDSNEDSNHDTEKTENGHETDAERTLTGTNNNNKNIYNDINIVAYPESQSKKYPEESFEMQCTEILIRNCLELYPNSKVPCTYKEKEKWAIEFEKMKRLDHRSEDEIRQVLLFAIENSFWKSVIRSAKKLREKFETLMIQSGKTKQTKPGKYNEIIDNMVNEAANSTLLSDEEMEGLI